VDAQPARFVPLLVLLETIALQRPSHHLNARWDSIKMKLECNSAKNVLQVPIANLMEQLLPLHVSMECIVQKLQFIPSLVQLAKHLMHTKLHVFLALKVNTAGQK